MARKVCHWEPRHRFRGKAYKYVGTWLCAEHVVRAKAAMHALRGDPDVTLDDLYGITLLSYQKEMIKLFEQPSPLRKMMGRIGEKH